VTSFPNSRLYAIIDAAVTARRSPMAVCEELLAAGVRLIQYRDKRASSRDLFENARQMASMITAAGGVFIVNDRVDVAMAAGADGVHLGQDDLPVDLARRVLTVAAERKLRTCLIGCSTHNLDQLRNVDASTADYLAFGPIFATQSKERPDPVVGLDGLRAARQATRKPLVAIGGITVATAKDVIAAGADAVAVIGALLSAADLGARVRQFQEAMG
jgi:thiamine-phosphate pyrophosphorylase